VTRQENIRRQQASFVVGFVANSRKEDSMFVGQWAAPLLLIGVYNKLVKVAGSDRISR
jgi:hypothetical protein